MIRPLLPILISLASLLLPTACGGNGGTADNDATPRRRAYPRLAEYDTVYAPAGGAMLPLELNAAAEVADSNAGAWLTVAYPEHRSVIYITITRTAGPDELQRTIDNRRERIALNLSVEPGTTTHTSSPGGFEAALVEAPGSGTPLQFIATDGRAYLVCGAAAIDGYPGVAYDSVSPIVGTLRRDIMHMLGNLRLP